MTRDQYREVYLRSDHWLETRKGALGRAGHRCQVCNTEHHKKRQTKKAKATCAYCRGKNGRHEQKCKRVEGEAWWASGGMS